MTRSLQATLATEATCERADAALRVPQQKRQEVGTSRDPQYELGCISSSLAIEPTADDVAQLVVKNQGDIFLRLSHLSPPILTWSAELILYLLS